MDSKVREEMQDTNERRRENRTREQLRDGGVVGRKHKSKTNKVINKMANERNR